MDTSIPSAGLGCLHLFYRVPPAVNTSEFSAQIDKFTSVEGSQAVVASLLGHKADMAVMALARDMRQLRELQTALASCGVELVDSYLSITEVSEYAQGVPEEMKRARLYPTVPPEGLNEFCFYPMSKSRNVGANWYTQDYEERMRMMMQHGKSGKEFRGRIIQLVTGSTGLDSHEWGVTLFGKNPDDLKDAVYTMRFDEASAKYGEFGDFYVGAIDSCENVFVSLGCES